MSCGASGSLQRCAAVSCAASPGGLPPPRTPEKSPPARGGDTFWGGPGGRQPPRGGRAANRCKNRCKLLQ
eukprot:382482-Alexandrium_andersonii.AAC.1